MHLLICFALKEEAAPFRKMAAGRAAAVPAASILITGIGRRNAEKSVREFLNSCRSRGDETQTNQNLETPYVVSYNKIVAAGAKPAKFFCAERIATTVAEKKKLRAESGADAVEMESAAIHAVCRERGIPCATMRVISDTANEDLPLDFNALAKPDMNLDYGKLAWAIARSPGKIGALLKLRKQTRFAAERLAVVLVKLI